MLYLAIRKTGGTGFGAYQATVHDDKTKKTLASGGFPTIVAAKQWGRAWAKARKTRLSSEVM
jgi:hypothetical protein